MEALKENLETTRERDSPGPEEARERIRLLEQELADTNRGLIALTTELEKKTEEVKAMTERQLLQAAQLATLGELAASIAHELNNPLTTITLRVESLLARTAPDDPSHQGLEIIGQETERMSNLVANLLQFSRRHTHQVSTIDVCEEVERTLDLIYRHLRNHRIAVQREFEPRVPMIRADRQQLRQVLLNLFNNAGDAMPDGGTLVVRVQCSKTSSSGVLIEVADTGSGIPEKDLSKVTEPFFTTKPEGKGTGLGLPICRRIMHEHRGTLEITSVVGKGTTVRLSFPVGNGGNAAQLVET